MNPILDNLWLIPVLPLVAAGVIAFVPAGRRRLAAGLSIASMAAAFALSWAAFLATLGPAGALKQTRNFQWLAVGDASIRLGWVLDPLTALMLIVVTFVCLLIFIYSVGYMAHDKHFSRFFCFLSFFAAAMLGIVIANSLLLLFACWELVGLASYLLIGFWHEKPAAADAAKKAFVTTRIGDIGLFLGMLWLYHATETLLFFDDGRGCLEKSAVDALAAHATIAGMAASTGISLLILCGAIGKSGQLPLHVWLPDAMEGPTPVSALIHAATMVAAGVFLVARVYPLMSATTSGGVSATLQMLTWIGAVTAVFAAAIAVAQDDIKRILAYSTISQLGYMMMGLGVGGVAVGMFHLTTHAVFKALLFLGAGSVIHGCNGEQSIRRMGGLKSAMPLTFAAYAVGMMALCGVPLFFSGFWSKDEILHAARHWSVSTIPFYLGAVGAFLTAFYMTRQIRHVFFGKPAQDHAHESPPVMTVPLIALAVMAVAAGFFGTPAWPWLQAYLNGEPASFDASKLLAASEWKLIALSTVIVGAAIALAWRIYANAGGSDPSAPDPLERPAPALFAALRRKLFVDEFYAATVVRLLKAFVALANWLDAAVWGGAVRVVTAAAALFSRIDRGLDERVVNGGFDRTCGGLLEGGRRASLWQNGQIQRYLRAIGVAFGALLLALAWRAA